MAICRVVVHECDYGRGVCVLTFPREMTEEEYMQVDVLYAAMQQTPNAVEDVFSAEGES